MRYSYKKCALVNDLFVCTFIFYRANLKQSFRKSTARSRITGPSDDKSFSKLRNTKMHQETQSQTVQTKEGVELLKVPLLTSNGNRRMSNSIGWFPISFIMFLSLYLENAANVLKAVSSRD